MRLVRFHTSAEREVDAALTWYETQQPGLGAEFLSELERSIDLLIESPAMWPIWPGIERGFGVRRCLLSRFPYGIAYISKEKEIVILAVAHMSRRPRYWQGRLESPGV